MSYTPWVNQESQVVPPKVWTPLWFTDPTEGLYRVERQDVLDGHTAFTLQVYARLLDPVMVDGVKTVGDRPSYVKTRFRRVFLDGTTPDDATAYDTVAIPLTVESWHHTHTMFLATAPTFTVGADFYHNGKAPVTLGTRILKGWNPEADLRVTIDGRLNPAP